MSARPAGEARRQDIRLAENLSADVYVWRWGDGSAHPTVYLRTRYVADSHYNVTAEGLTALGRAIAEVLEEAGLHAPDEKPDYSNQRGPLPIDPANPGVDWRQDYRRVIPGPHPEPVWKDVPPLPPELFEAA